MIVNNLNGFKTGIKSKIKKTCFINSKFVSFIGLFVPDKEVKLSIQSGNDKSSYQSGSDLSSYHRGNKISSYQSGSDISSYRMLPIAKVNSDWLSLLPFFFPLLPGFLITYIVLQYCMNRAMTNVAKRNRVRARRPTQRQLDQGKIRWKITMIIKNLNWLNQSWFWYTMIKSSVKKSIPEYTEWKRYSLTLCSETNPVFRVC